MTEHQFTNTIINILKDSFGKETEELFNKSELLQYINEKTISANKGSKSRGSFANLYAIYVLVEDYINKGYVDSTNNYDEYEGATYSDLVELQHELPFGKKLQNHALNSRLNGEFKKFFPLSDQEPVIRNLKTKRYWINERLLKININNNICNIAKVVLLILDEYIKTKQKSFQRFLNQCKQLKAIKDIEDDSLSKFLLSLVTPDMDARLFEIVSFAILKRLYQGTTIYWGYSKDKLNKESLKLYKTGRTNANDGGIDFVMRPLGRFFQATETLDFKKYFLDIDKLEHYPITFVIKSSKSVDDLMNTIRDNAKKTYSVKSVVDEYMKCIEEIINIPKLEEVIHDMTSSELKDVLDEIVLQSQVEFNQ